MHLQTAKRINRIFREKKLTLSVAESCTGGLISHYLTAIPGASSFFVAGLVTYSAAAKKNLLGIRQRVFATYGIVSSETAMQMAEKVRLLTGTDVSISTTGNLGPELLEGKAKGLVYIAISTRKGTVSRTYRFNGMRGQIKEKAASAALEFLAETVAHE
ncbi:MAG TPA: CinA family protein [Thermodesulfovibrionales bacterium]|nr:CinA family protein [Thermodesulfovibrionales bacterium]